MICKLCFLANISFVFSWTSFSLCHMHMWFMDQLEIKADRIWESLLGVVSFQDSSILFSSHIFSCFSFSGSLDQKVCGITFHATCGLCQLAQGWKRWKWEITLYNSPFSSSVYSPLESFCFPFPSAFLPPMLSGNLFLYYSGFYHFFYEGWLTRGYYSVITGSRNVFGLFLTYSISLPIIFMFYLADLKSLLISFLGCFFWLISLLFTLFSNFWLDVGHCNMIEWLDFVVFF